jgi:hypothetical protein
MKNQCQECLGKCFLLSHLLSRTESTLSRDSRFEDRCRELRLFCMEGMAETQRRWDWQTGPTQRGSSSRGLVVRCQFMSQTPS